MVGCTTKQFSALGMHEVANAQTFLEKPLDLKQPLLKVHRAPLRFLQLYVHLPHCHNMPKHHHLVTGCIVLCSLQHPQGKASLETQAIQHIQHVNDCSKKMFSQLSARLEAVIYLDEKFGIPSVLRPEDFINEVELESLLENYLLLLPFLDSQDCSLTNILKETLNLIGSELTNVYNSNPDRRGLFRVMEGFPAQGCLRGAHIWAHNLLKVKPTAFHRVNLQC